MSQFSKFPTMRTLSAGIAAGIYLTVPSVGRQQVGGSVNGARIVGFTGSNTVIEPFGNVQFAPIANASDVVLPVGKNGPVDISEYIDDTEVGGLRPVAAQLATVRIDAKEYTKEELLGLAAAAGVEVGKSWTKQRIVDTINAYNNDAVAA